MKVIFKTSEPFRASMLEKIGYVLCTPICIILMNILLTGFAFDARIALSLLVSAVSFYLGLGFLWQAYQTMYKLDMKIWREEDVGN